jgi:hypothetical protein
MYFRERFFKAQAKRNEEVLRDALKINRAIESGDRRVYGDDMPFPVPASDGAARLFQADTRLVNCTKRGHIFLARDGSTNVSTDPICSVRVPSASFEDADSYASYLNVSVKVWLGAHALRTSGRYEQTEDDIKGIDFASTNTSFCTSRPRHHKARPDRGERRSLFPPAGRNDLRRAQDERQDVCDYRGRRPWRRAVRTLRASPRLAGWLLRRYAKADLRFHGELAASAFLIAPPNTIDTQQR